ncbi:MAG: adenine deaminase [Gammaproteobacteria bacterium]|jgi:adenine deaminase
MNINKASYPTKNFLKSIIKVAKGEQPADLVIKNVNILDVFNGQFVKGDIAIYQDFIAGIVESYQGKTEIDAKDIYVVPGFIDAHLHIESSLMTPAQFQRMVLPCGTTSVIWDPHEIANVKGMEGIQWALKSCENLLLDVFIMLPSCVPSTNPELNLETNGAILYPHDLSVFKTHPRILGLAEIMNYPGILTYDDDILDKLMHFRTAYCDGHAPKISNYNLNAYAAAGIHNDHESITLEEAREKLTKGIACLIREGSCAKDTDTLLPIIKDYSASSVALCTDDRNPLEIFTEGHINFAINKALKAGCSPENIFKVASFSPSKMYGLNDRGAVAPGYKADLCLLKPKDCDWKNGVEIQSVLKNGKIVTPESFKYYTNNNFTGKNIHITSCQLIDFQVTAKNQHQQQVNIIGIRQNQLITDKLIATLPVISNEVQADITQDILKISVFERHKSTGYHATGFVKGFNLKTGAIATSINHDAHNVIVVGASDEAMLDAIRKLIEIDGGIVVTDGKEKYKTLALPIGGLMSNENPEEIHNDLVKLQQMAKKIGCQLENPFLQLSFLALPVIPSLKITDQGLIDVDKLKKIEVCC